MQDVKVYPTFRPDALLNFYNKEEWLQQVAALSKASDVTITDLDSFIEALQQRVDYFHEHGCRLSDHGLECMPLCKERTPETDTAYRNFVHNSNCTKETLDNLCGYILHELCKMYHKKKLGAAISFGSVA
jgi:glucuronate isomerase